MSDRFPVTDPARVSLETARAVEPPPFERVLDRARANRRRRLVATSVSGLAAAAVAAVALLTGLPPHTGGPAGPPSPARHSHVPHTPTASAALAERIVTDPRASLLDFVVAPNDPRVRAEIRGGALGLTGADTQWALAVTDDGYRSSHYLLLGGPGSEVVPLPDNGFFVGASSLHGAAWLVTSSGERTRVAFSHATRPMAAGEVLVQCGDWQFCALDPGTATAHWFPGPTPAPHTDPGRSNGLFQLWQSGQVGCQAPACSQVIWGFNQVQDEPTTHPRVYWTRDGGASWTSRPVPGALAGGPRLTGPDTGSTTAALVLAYSTGHGPRYSPQTRVHTRTLLRSLDAGTHWDTIRVPGAGDITDGALLPDGRVLLVTLSGRLLRSTDTTWHTWQSLPGWPTAPGYDTENLSVTHNGTLFSSRQPAGRDTGAVWTSTDAGSTWTRSTQPSP